MSLDEHFMRIALNRAKRNIGCVAPNPSVGCVITKDDTIISIGCTEVGGRPHAETVALKKANGNTKGARMYITMEPCIHHGITPPCVKAIIESEVSEVFIAIPDPNPNINGKGIEQLKASNIKVVLGTCKEEAKILNRGFLLNQLQKRPFITAKIACTLDSKIADHGGNSQWITSDTARIYAHRLRAKNDAVMVGINTLIKDDCLLNCRIPGMERYSPIPIILGTNNLNKPIAHLRIFDRKIKSKVIILSTSDHFIPKIPEIEYIKTDKGKNGKIDISKAMIQIASIGINNLLVEGGQKIFNTLAENDLIDRLIIIRSPVIAGGDATDIFDCLNLPLKEFKRIPHVESRTNIHGELIEIFERPLPTITYRCREDQDGSYT